MPLRGGLNLVCRGLLLLSLLSAVFAKSFEEGVDWYFEGKYAQARNAFAMTFAQNPRDHTAGIFEEMAKNALESLPHSVG